MKSVCLILTVAGHLLLGIDKPFPSDDSCNKAGFSMVDGRTTTSFTCVPLMMVDGLPTYDCGKVPDIDLTPPPTKCTFDIMTTDGVMATISAPCGSIPPGVVNMHEPEPRPPIPKYQKRME